MACQKRLLGDIYEIETNPYPNIHFVWGKEDSGSIHQACLVLTPGNTKRIHLSVSIPFNFPLQPPTIRCDTAIEHPNVMGHYICASILKNNFGGWTPAYTLKGVAIQILSFFSSETLEQDYGGAIKIQDWGRKYGSLTVDYFMCDKCGFNQPLETDPNAFPAAVAWTLTNPCGEMDALTAATTTLAASSTISRRLCKNIGDLPHELLAQICAYLENEDLINFAKSWDKIGGTNGVVTKFNILRNRELRCFVLKTNFDESQLGIGVKFVTEGRRGVMHSEFELLSRQAFDVLNIRHSITSISFDHWLPVPLSNRHYRTIQPELIGNLRTLSSRARLASNSPAETSYAFMNDVIVKLSKVKEEPPSGPPMLFSLGEVPPRSTLVHASEKAVESFYQLFHLLLCLAAENKAIVIAANAKLQNFKAGKTNKADCPNLGHLLLAILISDHELDEKSMKGIIQETITRNVVWMLDARGAGMAHLAYLESDEVSEHRLTKTFEATSTSYRLLMFFNLFRNTIDRGAGDNRKSILKMRDDLFDSHGAPPFGTAARLAAEVKGLEDITDFFSFLGVMGVEGVPTKKVMTGLLRKCVEDSMSKGYSRMGVSKNDAKALREGRKLPAGRVKSFFPNSGRH